MIVEFHEFHKFHESQKISTTRPGCPEFVNNGSSTSPSTQGPAVRSRSADLSTGILKGNVSQQQRVLLRALSERSETSPSESASETSPSEIPTESSSSESASESASENAESASETPLLLQHFPRDAEAFQSHRHATIDRDDMHGGANFLDGAAVVKRAPAMRLPFMQAT